MSELKLRKVECHNGSDHGTPTLRGVAVLLRGMRWTDLEDLARALDDTRCEGQIKSKRQLRGRHIDGWAEALLNEEFADAQKRKTGRQQASQAYDGEVE